MPKQEQPLHVFNADEVLAAGGPERFAKTKGIDTSKIKLSGMLDLSKAETRKILRQLRQAK